MKKNKAHGWKRDLSEIWDKNFFNDFLLPHPKIISEITSLSKS